VVLGACWAVELANVAYALTFGLRDRTIFPRSLIAAIALPVLLIVQIPVFFGQPGRSRSGATR
jgi:hypothetical protein